MRPKYILALACAALFFMGILAATIGPAIGDLAENTGSAEGDMGALFTFMFAGSLLAQFLVGPLMDRWGQRPVLLAAVIFLAPGALGIAFSPALGLMLGFSLIWGIGFGAMDAGSNVMVSSTFRGNVSVMNLLHVFFGVGSVLAPAMVSVSLSLTDQAIPVLWIGAAGVLLLIPFTLRLPRTLGVIGPPESGNPAAPFSYRVPLLWALGGILLLSVGMETGIGAWTTSYMDRTTSLNEKEAALVASAFWFALTGGRIMTAMWGHRFTPYQVLGMALAGSLVGAVVIAASTGSLALSVVGVLITGFCIGPHYPTVMGIATELFPNGPGRAAAVAAALGSIGGASLPWVQGQLLDNVSSSASVIFVAVQGAILLSLYAGLRSARARRTVPAVLG